MPKVYAPAVAKDGEKDKNVTHYLGFAGKGAIFERDKMVNISVGHRRNFQHADDRGSGDGRSLDQTRGPRIHRADSLLPKLGGQFKEGFVGVTADGFPRLFKKSLDPTLLVEMITYGGGEVIDLSGRR